jgi:hypothetical protein
MRRLAVTAVILAVVALPATAKRQSSLRVLKNLKPVAEKFNKASERTRFVAIVSPT